MLNSVISLVLAASLSSSELGTFFDLPDWMPREVSSHDTPGSDPQDGTGWYVTGEAQIETARVTRTTHFSPIERSYSYYNWETGEEMYTNGIVTSKVFQPTWDKNKRAWNVAGSILPEDKGTDEPEYVYGYDENPYILTWEWWDPSGYGHFYYAAKTDRTKEDRYYKTVQGTIPRSFRLTPEILAAFNSTFEAYFERMYFSSAGKSNVWNTVIYGPRDVRHFDFSKLRFLARILGEVEYPVFYFNPTSRVINTRRLVDYNNFYKLEQWLLDWEGAFLFAGRLSMPSWSGAWEDQYEWMDWWLMVPHWSTTASPWADYGFYDFNWTSRPFYAIDWSKVAVTFGSIINTYHGGNSSWDDSYYNSEQSWGVSLPLVGCLDKVFAGSKNGYGRSSILSAVANSQFYKEYQKVYPHADSGTSISWGNKTRRRSSKDIATINQVLGLMDRTYRNVDLLEYGAVSNYTGIASISDKAFVDVEVVHDAEGFRLDRTITPSEVEWSGATITNRYYPSGSEHHGAVLSSFSGTYSSSSPVSLSPASLGHIEINWELVQKAIEDAGLQNLPRITMTISAPYLSQNNLTASSQIMIGDSWDSSPSNSVSEIMWEFHNVSNSLLVTVHTDRRYTYKETFTSGNRFDGLQTPCNLARSSGRVKDEEVYAISSILSVDYDYDIGSLDSLEYFNGADNYNWKELYSGKTYASNLNNAIRLTEPNRILSYERDRLIEKIGTTPDDVENIVPVDDYSCLKTAKDNFSFLRASTISVISSFDRITLYIENSTTPRIYKGYAYYTNGMIQELQNGTYEEVESLPFLFANISASFDNADPRHGCTCTETDPFFQFGKCSFIHKIDWNWKALHRTDD